MSGSFLYYRGVGEEILSAAKKLSRVTGCELFFLHATCPKLIKLKLIKEKALVAC